MVIGSKVNCNTHITFYNIEDLNEGIKTISFFTKSSHEDIITCLEKRTLKNADDDKILHITIVNKDTLQRQRVNIFWDNTILDDIRFELLNYLVSEEVVVDVRSSRFEVIIRAKYSNRNDVKTLVFNDHRSFDDIFDDIRQGLESHPIDEWLLADNNVNTHYIILKYSGSATRRKMPSKTFSVKMPGYSSSDILEILTSKGDMICNQNT